MGLLLRVHTVDLSVCKLKPRAAVPAKILDMPFTMFFRTGDEATLVCPTAVVPECDDIERGYHALELIGPFDFALTGILVQVADPLAKAGVSILPLSTFATVSVSVLTRFNTSIPKC